MHSRLPSLQQALAAGAALTVAPASAAIPSPMWMGVERIVVDCQLDSVRDENLRRDLCRQIIQQAAQLTNYPVAMASGEDLRLSAERLRVLDRQLVLHVEGRLADRSEGSALIMSVQPERFGLRRWKGEATRPVEVELHRENGQARLLAPVSPLALILSPPRRGRGLPLAPRPNRF